MRSVRAAMVAIVATLALIGAFGSTANAITDALVVETEVTPPPDAPPVHDPGDPGLPPD